MLTEIIPGYHKTSLVEVIKEKLSFYLPVKSWFDLAVTFARAFSLTYSVRLEDDQLPGMQFPDPPSVDATKSKTKKKRKKLKKALWWLTLCFCKDVDVIDEESCIALDKPKRYENLS